MRRYPVLILPAILATACAGEAQQSAAAGPDARPALELLPAATPAGAAAAPSPAPPAPSTAAPGDDLNTIPAAACEPEAHVEFVNAFAQFAPQRSRFTTDGGRAQLWEFDVALVDYRWQRASDGVALELDMQRHGTRLDVAATPVERDAEDEPVRTLGPARRYAFEHRDGCWRYAGRS